jgi:hypothetical protein
MGCPSKATLRRDFRVKLELQMGTAKEYTIQLPFFGKRCTWKFIKIMTGTSLMDTNAIYSILIVDEKQDIRHNDQAPTLEDLLLRVEDLMEEDGVLCSRSQKKGKEEMQQLLQEVVGACVHHPTTMTSDLLHE